MFSFISTKLISRSSFAEFAMHGMWQGHQPPGEKADRWAPGSPADIAAEPGQWADDWCGKPRDHSLTGSKSIHDDSKSQFRHCKPIYVVSKPLWVSKVSGLFGSTLFCLYNLSFLCCTFCIYIYILFMEYLWNIYGLVKESNLIWFSDRAQSFGRGAAEHTSSTGLRTTCFLRDVRMNLQRNTHTFASHCCTYQIHPDTVAYHIFQAMVAHPMVLPARNSALQAIV